MNIKRQLEIHVFDKCDGVHIPSVSMDSNFSLMSLTGHVNRCLTAPTHRRQLSQSRVSAWASHQGRMETTLNGMLLDDRLYVQGRRRTKSNTVSKTNPTGHLHIHTSQADKCSLKESLTSQGIQGKRCYFCLFNGQSENFKTEKNKKPHLNQCPLCGDACSC